MTELSVQERYFADAVCFGCGPGDLADGRWATTEYAVKLVRPTPTDVPLELHARVVELSETEASTEARLESGGKVRATCTARFRRFVPR